MMFFSSCNSKTETILKSEKLSDFEYSQIDKIQIITAMGNPAYGADSKVITNVKEINSFIDTFNSGVIGKEIAVCDTCDSSRYVIYFNNEIIREIAFNGNNTNIIWWDDNFRNITYGEGLKTPFDLYNDSVSKIVVVNEEGKEMDLIRYNDNTYVKSKISEENLKWLEWYNSLPEEVQGTISFSPYLVEPIEP